MILYYGTFQAVKYLYYQNLYYDSMNSICDFCSFMNLAPFILILLIVFHYFFIPYWQIIDREIVGYFYAQDKTVRIWDARSRKAVSVVNTKGWYLYNSDVRRH